MMRRRGPAHAPAPSVTQVEADDTFVEAFSISDHVEPFTVNESLESSLDSVPHFVPMAPAVANRVSPVAPESPTQMDCDDDDLEVFELPPELGWLNQAASHQLGPGGVGEDEDSVAASVQSSGVHDAFGGMPMGGAGFSRPDSRASTPESVVAELAPKPAAAKRAFALPPRPQHGTMRSKGGNRAGAPRGATPTVVSASSSNSQLRRSPSTSRTWTWRGRP